MKNKSLLNVLCAGLVTASAWAQTGVTQTGVIYSVTLSGVATFHDAKKNKTIETTTRKTESVGVSAVAINNRVILETMLDRELLGSSTTIAGWTLIGVTANDEAVQTSSFFYAYKNATKTAGAVVVPVPSDLLAFGEESEQISIAQGSKTTVTATSAISGSSSDTSSESFSFFGFSLKGATKAVSSFVAYKSSSTATPIYAEVSKGSMELAGFGMMPTGYSDVKFTGGEEAYVTLKASFSGRVADISSFVVPIVQQ